MISTRVRPPRAWVSVGRSTRMVQPWPETESISGLAPQATLRKALSAGLTRAPKRAAA